MSLVFMDGFDHYNTTNIFSKWNTYVDLQGTTAPGSNISISNNGRNGSSGLLPGNGLTGISKSLDAQPTYIVGFAIKIFNVIASNVTSRILSFYDNGSIQGGISINPDNSLSFFKGTSPTILGTSNLALSLNQYYYLECKYTPNSSISANTCILRINGQNVINLPATTNTRTTANNSINTVGIGLNNNNQTGTGATSYDDLYICNLSGAINNDFLGDIRIETILPSGSAQYSQFARQANLIGSNYLSVNEAQLDSDTTYVETSGIALSDSYTFQSLRTIASGIKGVQFLPGTRKTDGGFRMLGNFVRISGVDIMIGSGNVNDTFVYQTTITEMNPYTSGVWTQSDVTALEAGFRLLA